MPPNQNIYLINFFSIENPTSQDHDEEETKKKIAELVSSQDFYYLIVQIIFLKYYLAMVDHESRI